MQARLNRAGAKKVRHADRGARWAKKHGKAYCGYKLYPNVDKRLKFIRCVKVTPANVGDGQAVKPCWTRAMPMPA